MKNFKERASKYFQDYKKQDSVHFTSDGTAFFEKNPAENHAKSLPDTTLTTIERSEVSDGAEAPSTETAEAAKPTKAAAAAKPAKAAGAKATAAKPGKAASTKAAAPKVEVPAKPDETPAKTEETPDTGNAQGSGDEPQA